MEQMEGFTQECVNLFKPARASNESAKQSEIAAGSKLEADK